MLTRVITCCISFFLAQCLVISPYALAEYAAREPKESQCCRAAHAHGLSWVKPGNCNSILICIHGLGSCAKSYEILGERLSDKGIATFAIDVHGFGRFRNSDRRYKKFDINSTLADLDRILSELKLLYPGKPIFILGESMGGSIAIRLALEQAKLCGVICSAPAWKIYKQKRIFLRGLLSWLFGSHKRLNLVSKEIMKQATSNKELRQHWLVDKSHRLDFTPSEALHLVHFIRQTQKNAAKLDNVPVLVVQGMKDRLVKANGTAKLFDKIPSHNKELLLIANSEHLIFEEGQCSDEIINLLTNWIRTESQNSNHIEDHVQGVLLAPYENKQAARLFRQAGIKDISVMNNRSSK